MKIAIAMSGGVDFIIGRRLTKEEDTSWSALHAAVEPAPPHHVDENGDPLPSRCCSLDDVYDARRVAGI